LQALEIDIIEIECKKARALAMVRKLYRKLKKGGGVKLICHCSTLVQRICGGNKSSV
jgi:hypothetical protein